MDLKYTKNKYLKYKNKYISLKNTLNMKGGAGEGNISIYTKYIYARIYVRYR